MGNNILEKKLPAFIYDADTSIYENLKIYHYPIEEIDNLAYASESYSVRKIKRDANQNFTTVCEALRKTYPVRILIDRFLYMISNILKQHDVVVEITEDGKTIKNSYVYHNVKPDEHYEGDLLFGYGKDDYEYGNNFKITAYTLNLDKEIAGNVLFVIDKIGYQSVQTIEDIENDLKSKLHLLSHAGHSSGYNYVETVSDNDVVVVKYESMYKEDNLFIPKYLYHLTTISKIPKILKYGLTPKSKTEVIVKNKNPVDDDTDNDDENIKTIHHPDRVYLFTRDDPNLYWSIIDNSPRKSFRFNQNTKKLEQRNEYAVLRIDAEKLHDFHLFFDNEYFKNDINNPSAVYTYDNIPPSAIKPLAKIRL